MRRDADVGARVEQQVERGARSSRASPGSPVGDLRRLDVDALAEPDVEARGRRAPGCRRPSAAGRPAARCRRSRAPPRAARGRAGACRRSSTSPPCRCGRSCRHRGQLDDVLEVLAEDVVVEASARARSASRSRSSRALLADRAKTSSVRARDRPGLVGCVISSPRTSIVAIFPAVFRFLTTWQASVELGARDVARRDAPDHRLRHRRHDPDDRLVEDAHVSRMNPWRAALTSATASGKSTRMASRSAIACSSGPPAGEIWLRRGGRQLDRRVQRQGRELLASAPPARTRPGAPRTPADSA